MPLALEPRCRSHTRWSNPTGPGAPLRGASSWSNKKEITYVSNGARIVTLGDVDADGDLDVIAASYYDNTVRWFENDGSGSWLGDRVNGAFVGHVITTTAINAQGVVGADIDGDGDLDLATASSGDNTVAWYTNLGDGRFCELKTVVDRDARGVRTVVAADLDVRAAVRSGAVQRCRSCNAEVSRRCPARRATAPSISPPHRRTTTQSPGTPTWTAAAASPQR